ncbi:MAG TPA: 6-bladed beta-propeller [Candidatus Cloacimonadota bacterium]|nr:6-bladed beta-propeller [Candidatus Cloacimonadota bacterium]
MNIEYLSCIIVTIILNGCKSSTSDLFHFDPKTLKEKEITLSQIADEVSYIQLDNTFPLDLIISSIKFTNTEIYLNSRDLGILAFDRNGKFINRIGGIGRGPGEYLGYLTFCVNDKSGTVYVLDIGNVIKVFSRAGQFIRSFSFKGYGPVIENMVFYDTKLFIQYAAQYKSSDYEWIFCDTLGNVIKKQERHLPEFTNNWGAPYPICIFEKKICYYNGFADTVFSISSDMEEIPSMIISPAEHRVPRSNLSLEQIRSGKYLILGTILETNHYFIIIYSYHKTYHLTIIYKRNHESFLIDLKDWNHGIYRNGITNDIDGGHYFIPEEYFSENGKEYMVGVLYPSQIRGRLASEEFKNTIPKYPEEKKELIKLAESLKDTDNPVLVLVRLKQ